MNKAGLVRLRNLDPEIINFILGKGTSSEALPYVKQSDLAFYFNKNTDLVGESLLDPTIKDSIVNLTLDKIKKSNIYRKNADSIEYDDLDSELKRKIDAAQYGGTGTVPQNLIDDINSLKQSNRLITTSINNALVKIDANKDDIQNVKDEASSKIREVNQKASNNSTEINTLKDAPGVKLTKDQIDSFIDAAKKIGEINLIASKLAEIQKTASEFSLFINYVQSNGTPGEILALTEDKCFSTKSIMSFWAFVTTNEELEAEKVKKTKFIFDKPNRTLYTATPKEDTGEIEYKKNEAPLNDPKFMSTFIYDLVNNILYYNNEELLEMSFSQKQKTKDIIISANNSSTANINAALYSGLQVLVLDEDPSSRTNGKYINSEGVVTISYDANQVSLYNDTLKELKIRLLYRE